MEFKPTAIPDVILVELQVFADERGYFMETYQRREFHENGIDTDFIQDNHSLSRQGTLRGLHYQVTHAQGKLVRVTAGEVFDVCVDLRRRSKTFGRWVAVELSAESNRQVWIPPGFAHGFYVMNGPAEVLYKVTESYAPEWERTLLWNDPAVGIRWPIPEGQMPLISNKDAQGKQIDEAEVYE